MRASGIIAAMLLAAPAIGAGSLQAFAGQNSETQIAPTAPAVPAPVCETKDHHAFDFWIGEWDVYDPDGNLVGSNSVQPAESGCLIIEHWTNAGGGTGQSYNFLDPGSHQWRQLWVSRGAVIDYTGGLTEDGSMLLEGEIRYQGTSVVAPFTGEWTQNEDGSVKQHFRQQSTDTGEWSDWFVGRYVRKSEE